MTLERIATRLGTGMTGRVAADASLARFTTYRLGGPAALLVEPAGPDDLELLAQVLRQEDPEDRIAKLVVGRGSNLVVSDRGWDGLAIRIGGTFSWIQPWDDEDLPAAGVRAGAGTSLPQLANWAARRGLRGLEWAVGVPGSVGGAVRMNAGAHGTETSGTLREVTLVDLVTGASALRGAADLDLDYRHSNLQPHEVVVEAFFELAPDDPDAIKERTESFRKHRAATQPGAAQNAGSVFTNPPGDSAGRLVESAGLKGFRVGGASVSELHANFFMAEGTAAAQDVFDLVQEVRRRVRESSGVDLVPEIRFVGPFEEPRGGV